MNTMVGKYRIIREISEIICQNIGNGKENKYYYTNKALLEFCLSVCYSDNIAESISDTVKILNDCDTINLDEARKLLSTCKTHSQKELADVAYKNIVELFRAITYKESDIPVWVIFHGSTSQLSAYCGANRLLLQTFAAAYKKVSCKMEKYEFDKSETSRCDLKNTYYQYKEILKRYMKNDSFLKFIETTLKR